MSAPTTATFVVRGMHCASCGMLIYEVVEDLAGVVASATSVRRGRTVVTYDPTQSTVAEIAAAIVG
ncbi:MAG: cation transporter, partial [Actinomycetota bacterium]|nr:cation transporter [Actinomycetota bacterium]